VPSSTAPRILLVGGGYVGLYAALRLERRLRPAEADLTLVSPENFMVYQPLLPEVASGTLEPRHAVVPLRQALRRTRLVTGRLEALDHPGRLATVAPHDGSARELRYDHVVLGLGSMTRVLPIPGVAERAVGFQTVTEAIHLRNHVLARLEVAEATDDERARRRALTFVFVGGGYTGVEALAELEDMARACCDAFTRVRPPDLRWILVEATDGILPTVEPGLAAHALRTLRSRGIEVHLETTLESAEDGRMRLSTGVEVEADTLVWMAGIRPQALTGELGLPVDDSGRLVVDSELRVAGAGGAWAAGDNAAVPDPGGGHYPPTAQHAQRAARRLADNLVATLRDEPLRPFRHDSLGELVTLGRYKGVASMRGLELRGFLPWLLRRLYYVVQVPTVNRKLRIVVDWLVGIPFRREIVSLGSLEDPRLPIDRAARETGG